MCDIFGPSAEELQSEATKKANADAAAAQATAEKETHDAIIASATDAAGSTGLRSTVLTGVNGDQGYGNNVLSKDVLATKKKTMLGAAPGA